MKHRTGASISFLIFVLSACAGGEYRLPLTGALTPLIMTDNVGDYYHIFVGSFSDSNRDGVGDLQGIINRIDYLQDGKPNSGKSLGVDGLYLSPIHPSTSYHKYDVMDYKNIDSKFGTLATFDKLIEAANQRGLKIILDLVVNHTSRYHPWFLAARKAILDGDFANPFIDYYTIVRGNERKQGHTYYLIGNDYYYEGNFSSDMPEINGKSQAVKDEWASILRFWLDRGVAGFRLDAAKYIDLTDRQETLAFWDWFMTTAKAIYPDVYVVGEVWSSENEILPYYEYFSNFDFGMSQYEGEITRTALSIQSIQKYFEYLINNRQQVQAVNPDAIMTPFLANHDMDRPAGYLSVLDYRMHMAANLYLLSSGNSYIYYGEELGMKGSRGSANTDANRRLAMLWGDNDSVRNPVGTTYPESSQTKTTVRSAKNDQTSLYNHYKKLLAIKKAFPEIARGTYTAINLNSFFVGGLLFTYNNRQILIIHNVGENPFTLSLNNFNQIQPFTNLVTYVGKGDATITNQSLTIQGLTTVVLSIL
jgi:alpha-amylase